MSILFGILLYFVCIAFFCTLTGINRLDDSERQSQRVRESALPKETSPPASVPAREAHG